MGKLRTFAFLSFVCSVPSLLMPVPGNKTVSTDKYAVFKGMAAEKPSESTATFGGKGKIYNDYEQFIVIFHISSFWHR